MDDDIKEVFQTEDFIAFGCLLALSSIVGIYFAYKDRKNATISAYFFGDGNVNFVAVGLSLVMTFQSSHGMISTSAESYIVGDMMFLDAILDIVTAFLAITYFVPAFHRLKIATVFEYLDLRFNKYIGRFAGVLKTFGGLIVAGFLVYLPAAALNAVTPLSLEASILLTSGFCVFYTALGGVKAVVWTDVLQALVTVMGMLAIFIQGMISIGGFENLSNALERGERNTLKNFDNGLIARISPLALCLSTVGFGLNATVFTQTSMQRYKACRTIKLAQYAVLVYLIPNILLSVLNIANGLVMYGYFEGCDPVMSGKIQNIDQAVPYFVATMFSNLPGLVGIFVASVFSATLSTVSSTINAYSIVIVEDMIAPCSIRIAKSERIKLILGKVLIIVLGGFITLVAFATSFSSSNILPLILGFIGVIGGPLSGVYCLGFFFPWANSAGAAAGLVSSFGLVSYMFIGSQFFKIPYPENIPPRVTDKCPQTLYNSSTASLETYETTSIVTTTIFDGRSTLQNFYNLNYNLSMFFGIITVIVVGLLASLLSGPNDPTEADPRLFIPIIDRSCFPDRVRKFFRFGVPEIEHYKKNLAEADIEDDKL